MTKIKIQIKNRWTGSVIFEYESENNTIKETLLKAVESDADLSDANLSDADLSDANLSDANLSDADLSDADLRGANLSDANLSDADLSDANLGDADLRDADLRGADLRGANLRDANLSGANLIGADLQPIKDDFFAVLIRAIPEIKFLKQNIIEGKIDGSTYDGECACLSGTLYNGATIHNGELEGKIKKQIMGCRNPSRPIERFFLGINKGDTPQTNEHSKLALEWIEEFEALIPKSA